MLTVAEASERILAEIRQLDVESVPLRRALGRVCAEDIAATVTMPPWSNSSMDGYAVRSADITPVMSGEPVKLRVVATIEAGQFASRRLKRGEAMRIMTGAPVPAGADSVIRKEHTDGGSPKVEIRDATDVWKNIRPAGEDYHAGDLLAKRGTPVKPALIGVLASSGVSMIRTFKRPRVAIISSGNELVDIDDFDEVVAQRRIVSSNSYTLDALTRVAGGLPPTARRRHQKSQEKSRKRAVASHSTHPQGLRQRSDYARCLRGAGGEQRFQSQTARPLSFGMLDDVPWLGVSATVSAMVSFELFVRPVLRKMQGHSALFRRTVTVILERKMEDRRQPDPFSVRSSRDGDGRSSHASRAGSSGALTSMVKANALPIVPGDSPKVAKGHSSRR
jgi:molybdopterin molybdotransferase